jgi:hypothetical protein
MKTKVLPILAVCPAFFAVLFAGPSGLSPQAHAAQPASTLEGSTSRAEESVFLSARRFSVVYPDGLRERHPELPSVEDLEQVVVVLAVKNGVFVSVGGAEPGVPTESRTLGESKESRMYRGDALLEISEAIVQVLNRRGIYGVFAEIDSRDLVEGAGADARVG